MLRPIWLNEKNPHPQSSSILGDSYPFFPQIQMGLTYSNIFQHIPTYSNIFQHIPTHSNIFQHIPTYSNITPTNHHSKIFQLILPIPAMIFPNCIPKLGPALRRGMPGMAAMNSMPSGGGTPRSVGLKTLVGRGVRATRNWWFNQQKRWFNGDITNINGDLMVT